MIISIGNQKGGVGKTTIAVHLVHYLSTFSKRVLAVDLDSQGNLTATLLGSEPHPEALSSSELFAPIDSGKKPQKVDDTPFCIVGANSGDRDLANLAGADFSVMSIFSERFKPLMDEYDYIIIDTPPNMGLMQYTSIAISDFFFVPMYADSFSPLGVSQLIRSFQDISEKLGADIQPSGFIINAYTGRASGERQILAALEEQIPDLVMKNKLVRRSAYSQVHDTGKPVWANCKSGAQREAADEMLALMGEICRRCGIKVPAKRKPIVNLTRSLKGEHS